MGKALSSGRAQVRGLPGKTPPCTLIVPDACKIRRGCNVFQVPIQNYSSGCTKAGKPSPPWQIKTMSPDSVHVLRFLEGAAPCPFLKGQKCALPFFKNQNCALPFFRSQKCTLPFSEIKNKPCPFPTISKARKLDSCENP